MAYWAWAFFDFFLYTVSIEVFGQKW
jgi:hypothetical protein